MSTVSRVLLILSGSAAVLVLLATTLLASGYPPREFGDWLFLLPLVAPLLTALLAGSLRSANSTPRRVIRGLCR
jgi:hypothetical protein